MILFSEGVPVSSETYSPVSAVRRLKVARVSTVPFFVLTQLRAQLSALADAGATVHVICSPDELSNSLDDLQPIQFHPVPISREINLLKDMKSLLLLIRLFRSENYDVVHSTTPKAGLLCAIAGRIARVPTRLHTFTGQPWVTMAGAKKHILKLCDKVIIGLNTHNFTDSQSQLDFLVADGVAARSKLSVIGSGSLAGVDLKRFDKARFSKDDQSALRAQLNIPSSANILLFVGRVTADKGLRELLGAFIDVFNEYKDTYLVFVGPFEAEGQAILESYRSERSYVNIRSVGFSSEPEKYMAIAQLLCIPSYREGFGTVVIESAAMGLPTVGSEIYGLTDAVVQGETGVLVPVRDSGALSKALIELLTDEGRRNKMANAARLRAINSYGTDLVSRLLIDEYERYSK
jgi:glycosyltransferase involved in cell wall biosynthesis